MRSNISQQFIIICFFISLIEAVTAQEIDIRKIQVYEGKEELIGRISDPIILSNIEIGISQATSPKYTGMDIEYCSKHLPRFELYGSYKSNFNKSYYYALDFHFRNFIFLKEFELSMNFEKFNLSDNLYNTELISLALLRSRLNLNGVQFLFDNYHKSIGFEILYNKSFYNICQKTKFKIKLKPSINLKLGYLNRNFIYQFKLDFYIWNVFRVGASYRKLQNLSELTIYTKFKFWY